MISLTTPMPLAEAVAKLNKRTPIGALFNTEEWAQMPLALRERAFFSAGIESARLLQEMHDKLMGSIALQRERVAHGEAFMDRSSFIGDMRALAKSLGIGPKEPAHRGTLRDIQAPARLGMICDIQIGAAHGHATWKMDQDEDVLDAFPAQELVRMEARRVPRPWRSRWTDAGGRDFDGRMIALKTDPIWTAISRFDVPWPPFDFNSGMGVEDIDREEAESLGLIKPGEKLRPMDQEFNDGLEASARGLDPKTIGALEHFFGDQIVVEGDTVRWARSAANDGRIFVRDFLGEFATAGGPLSYDKNLKRGNAAIKHARLHKTDVPNAMNVKGIGKIGFKWGVGGDPAKQYEGGSGLAHILEKHGSADLEAIPWMILNAKSRKETQEIFHSKKKIRSGHQRRYVKYRQEKAQRQIRIELEGVNERGPYTVTLIQQKNRRSAFLLTGFTRGVAK